MRVGLFCSACRAFWLCVLVSFVVRVGLFCSACRSLFMSTISRTRLWAHYHTHTHTHRNCIHRLQRKDFSCDSTVTPLVRVIVDFQSLFSLFYKRDRHTLTKETYKYYKRDRTGPLILLVSTIVDFQCLFSFCSTQRDQHTLQKRPTQTTIEIPTHNKETYKHYTRDPRTTHTLQKRPTNTTKETSRALLLYLWES